MVAGGGYVGGLAGKAKNVSRSYADVPVAAKSAVGGLLGLAEEGGTVEACFAAGAVSSTSASGTSLGGLVLSLIHLFRKTPMKPRLEAGQQLLALARRLPKVGNGDEAAAWLADYAEWCSRWERFLREFTLKDGRRLYTHERLRSARHSLNALVKKGTMFTFVQLQDCLLYTSRCV